MDYQIKEIHNQISDIEKEASMHQLQIDAAVFEIRDQLQRLLREQDTIPLHFIIKFYYKIKINVYENDLPKFLNENQKELILKIGQLEYEIDKLRNKANKQNLLLKSSCISSENSNKYT